MRANIFDDRTLLHVNPLITVMMRTAYFIELWYVGNVTVSFNVESEKCITHSLKIEVQKTLTLTLYITSLFPNVAFLSLPF